jgi:hypothetical protein
LILILNSPVIQGIVTLLTLLTIASVTWFVIRLIQFLVDGAHLLVGGGTLYGFARPRLVYKDNRT